MAQNNAINNRSSTLTVDNLLTVSAGGATITGNSTINGGTVGIGTDNAANGITIGTGTTGRLINIGLSAAPHTIVMGTTNTTASMSLQSGTGNTVVNSAGTTTVTGTGGVSINSISGAINVGNDANANAINVGTGAAARTITVGNTTGATAVNIDIGTGDFTLDSATGRIIDAADAGQINYPLQPAFLAYVNVGPTNVTGAGAAYTIINDTEVFDVGANYNNATGVFTAPVTGKYFFSYIIGVTQLTVSMNSYSAQLVTSNRSYVSLGLNPSNLIPASTNVRFTFSVIADMDASDTASLTITIGGGAGDTVDMIGVSGALTSNTFSGYLLA